MTRKSKKHARRRARENALALLYSGDIIESDAVSIVEDGRYPAGEINLSDYAESLVKGVMQHLDEIDERLVSSSENWALDRMPVVDRAILRLAVYEMLYVDEVPVSVAINEAVELAKAYGGEDESSRFVNGVLGRIARSESGESAKQDEATDASEKADAPEAATAEEEATADATAAATEDAFLETQEPSAEKPESNPSSDQDRDSDTDTDHE